jgi:hypothetical protein
MAKTPPLQLIPIAPVAAGDDHNNLLRHTMLGYCLKKCIPWAMKKEGLVRRKEDDCLSAFIRKKIALGYSYGTIEIVNNQMMM